LRRNLRRNAPSAPEEGRVDDLNHEGEGVVHAGKTAFVAGALPGERVRFVRRRVHSQHDEAELQAVLEASPERVLPRCAHFGVCGGCALQHLDAAAQLLHKQRQLRESLERIGKVAPREWLPPLAGPEWNYRRRARLGARYVAAQGRSLVGFRERFSSNVAALDSCVVLARPVDALIAPLGELLSSLAIRERVPQVEVAIGDPLNDDPCTALVFRVLDEPGAEDLARFAAFEAAHAVRVYLQPKGLASMRPLAGDAPVLEYALPEFDLRMQFLPSDFIQVNGELNRMLVGKVVELLGLDTASRVLDLYCGLGNFSLALARHAARVVGVEGEAGLVERARANARRNGLANVDFHVGNLMAPEALTAPWANGPYSHVLLDPPRAGAREMLPLVVRLRPQRVIYVSCHPGSLARDLGELVHEHGYELLSAGVADMFPHTAHVESLAVLAPRKRA
jgi:23S rRNA (uracil1939-C5)-methyltransferase